MQQEIKATFGKMKPLQGASVACQKYINYLMCYICSPDQFLFYKNERLTVCQGFCDKLYDACNSAILKGSVIRHLYANGREFCRSRRFQVNTVNCFTFDQQLDVSGGRLVETNVMLVFTLLLCCAMYMSDVTGIPVLMRKYRDRRTSKQSAALVVVDNDMRDTDASSYSSYTTCSVNKRVVLLLCLVNLCTCTIAEEYMVKPLDEAEMTKWARVLSDSLLQLSQEGLHHEDIQLAYDEAQYEQDVVDGMVKIQQLQSNLGMCS